MCCERSGCRVSLMRVDFPDPDTPDTQINVPSGKVAVTLRKLLPFAPMSRSCLPLPLRRWGIAMKLSPLR